MIITLYVKCEVPTKVIHLLLRTYEYDTIYPIESLEYDDQSYEIDLFPWTYEKTVKSQ